ncbi:MAG TPA: 3-ketoacyl-ACP reductase [Rhodobacteraceae bacterium]|mgnify:FL=1|jgi:NAD(P)-dependent dehydrogenase (short-subunit alcohol dehydrogenase family)|nr:SDR family oxidoreductase [Rhodobacter sp.]HBN29993.1 3-ketoacyl-ACP reductase [Paracoccaceae bacterium]
MKVALTGGATGIGAATAAALKAKGAHVTAFDINEPTANIDQWVRLDLSSMASIKEALDNAEGPYDVLINNAGLSPRAGLAEVVLKVNYFGFAAFAEGMLGNLAKGASIVNVASRAGINWRQNIEQVKAFMALTDRAQIADFIRAHNIDHVRAYDLSKEAVIVWTIANTERLKNMDMRANSVSPAAVSTGILDDFIAAFGERATKNIARAGRAGSAEEIADVIMFLTSPESRWLKGADISPDGGMLAMAQSDLLGLN